MKKKSDWIKFLGFTATAITFGAAILADWVKEKEMDDKIEEKVNLALAAGSEDEEES